MLEIIDKTFDEDIPDKEIYKALSAVMHYFNNKNKNLNNAFYYFVLHFLKNSGYDILNAKKHPIVVRFEQKNQNLLSDLNNIFNTDFSTPNKIIKNLDYDKKIMTKFMSELVRYHFPDVKSFKVAKDVFN